MSDLFDPRGAPSPKATNAASGGRLGARGGRLGRPPGAHGKRSPDLAKYIAATFGGLTPGQQAAELGLVKPAEVKSARRDAQQLVGLGLMSPVVLELGLSGQQLAQAVKAARLAKALGCEARDAWLLGQKERQELMPYVHQKLPIAADEKGQALPTMFVVAAEDLAASAVALAAPAADVDLLEDFGERATEVGQAQSDEPS